MGSLITALQNQNIAAANQETLGDIYSANPQNLGYTENPFGYTSSPAVIQTAYPQYGYNATAPMMPPSYEDYDLTTLFGMLQGMQSSAGTQGDAGPMAPPNLYVNTQGDAGPMMPLPNMPSPYLEPMVPHMPSPDLGPMVKPMVPNMPSPYLEPMVPSMPSPGPVTPAGILAQLAGEVQQQTGQTTPVPGAYTVPGTEPVVAEEEEDTQAASDERIRQLIAENAAKQQRRELEQRYARTTGLVVNPNQSSGELRQVLDDPSSPFNVTE